MKQVMKHNGDFVDADDCWVCPDCGYCWGGHERPPPYPHCPECNYGMIRKVEP